MQSVVSCHQVETFSFLLMSFSHYSIIFQNDKKKNSLLVNALEQREGRVDRHKCRVSLLLGFFSRQETALTVIVD